jgi:hypothetical protein
MPIRTNRGRAVVYRRLWAWPLRSPRHLAMAAVILAALIIAVGILMPGGSNSGSDRGAGVQTSQTPAPATRTTSGSGGASAAPPPSVSSIAQRTVTTTPPVSAPPAQEALNVGTAWARAWVDHPAGITSEQWVAKLAPMTTEEFIPQLRTVDPANIPSTTVTGTAKPTSSTASAVELDIATDAVMLHLTVIATPAGWRVSAYDRSG